jgi:hypothetical protein
MALSALENNMSADYDTSTPGIQGIEEVHGATVLDDGSIYFAPNELYEERQNRDFTYRSGIDPIDFAGYVRRNGVGGNQSHAGNILNDMLLEWDKGNTNSYGNYTARLLTSDMFDEATQLADMMGSLYMDGHSKEQIYQMIGLGNGVAGAYNLGEDYTPSFGPSQMRNAEPQGSGMFNMISPVSIGYQPATGAEGMLTNFVSNNRRSLINSLLQG